MASDIGSLSGHRDTRKQKSEISGPSVGSNLSAVAVGNLVCVLGFGGLACPVGGDAGPGG